jgi:hypothetical protein
MAREQPTGGCLVLILIGVGLFVLIGVAEENPRA